MGVCKQRMNIFKRKSFWIFFLFTFGLSGCLVDPEYLCSRKIYEVAPTIDQAIEEINRESQKAPPPIPAHLPEREKEKLMEQIQNDKKDRIHKWTGWSIKNLKETQSLLSITGHDLRIENIKEGISKIANHWVEFYGYAQLENRKNMISTLRKIQAQHLVIRQISCAAGSNNDPSTPAPTPSPSPTLKDKNHHGHGKHLPHHRP